MLEQRKIIIKCFRHIEKMDEGIFERMEEPERKVKLKEGRSYKTYESERKVTMKGDDDLRV